MDTLLAVLLILLIFVLIFVAYRLYQQRKAPPALPPPRPKALTFLTYDQLEPFVKRKLDTTAQSPFWREKMLAHGRAMQKAGVRGVFFIHGTFTGNDPLGIVHFLKMVYPNLSPQVEARVRAIIRRGNNRWLKDTGNFTPAYTKLFSEATGRIPCHEFVWSSENHHIGRLRSTAALLEQLGDVVEAGKLGARDRLLLIAHSHGGQLLALLTLLMQDDEVADRLFSVMTPELRQQTLNNITRLGKVGLDFVTFGMPLRYPWGKSFSKRLMNIVNHRGDSHLAGPLRGMFHTRSGDYIQQIGVAGSDLVASHKEDRVVNRFLDQCLDTGCDLRLWAKELKKLGRVPPCGHTFLVDYRDGAKALPNGAVTLFGHGIYTRAETMLFNTKIVVDHFYRTPMF